MDFFIVGTSRSGSTLLRNMLAAHPAVAVLNESHWIPRMVSVFGSAEAPVDALIAIVEQTHWDSGKRVVDVNLELAGRTWESVVRGLRDCVGDTISVASFHDALVDAMFSAAPDTRCRGDKTPDYGFYMESLQRLWTDARFVHVVRNGIDTASSMSRHSGCQLMISAGYDNWVPLSFGRAYERYERVELPFSSYVASWRRRMTAIRGQAARLRPGAYAEVRYEELIEHPRGVLDQVGAHLGLSVDDGWVERCAALVRPPRRRPVTATMLGGISSVDRQVLRDVGGIDAVEKDLGRSRGPLVMAAPTELTRIDGNPLPPDPAEVLLFCCVRNEALRLPCFIDYYRRLGVSRFFFVDNDSIDRTRPFLLAQRDAHVFYTAGSYAGSNYGMDWLNALLGQWAAGHWVLVVDADELLVYPGSESEGLATLTRRLENAGDDALLTFLLDMYAAGPIHRARLAPGASFVDVCPYFDGDSYDLGARGLYARIPARGGARRRLFWAAGERQRGKPPYLPKIPLVRWSEGREYRASTHDIPGVRLASTTGALLHFKLLSDFVERCQVEVQRGEHWDEAAQYSAYAQRLAAEPDLDPVYPGSVRFRDSRQLVDLGLVLP